MRYDCEMKNRFKNSGLVLAALLAVAPFGQSLAHAQNSGPAIAMGQRVVDPQGRPLGTLERIITDASGQPRQVVLRTLAIRGGAPSALKVLPIEALLPPEKPATPPVLVAPLTREEIDLLPNAQ
jgi:hypothetical protein